MERPIQPASPDAGGEQGGLFRRLFDQLLSDDEAAAGAPPVPAAHVVPPPSRIELERFLGRLGELVDRDGEVLSGHLHLLGLDRIRQQLGDRWARHAATAQAAANAVIERHLEAGDFHVRYGELSFLVAFARREPAAAREACRRMAAEISRLLMGEHFDGCDELVASAVFTDDGTLVRRLVADVTTVPPAGRTQRAPVPPALSKVDGKTMVQALRLRYVPVWEISRRVVTTYYAVPVVEGFFGRTVCDHEARLHLHAFLPDIEFDVEVARLAVADLVRSLLSSQPTLVCWQVDFETLATRRGREIYLGLLQQLPDQARRQLVLEMAGFTDAVPPARLAEATGLLRPYCRFQIARVAPEFSRMALLAECQFRVVGTNFHGSGAARTRATAAFAAHANQAHLRSYAAGLHGAHEVVEALDAGCELVTCFDAAVMTDHPGLPHHIDPAALRRPS